MNITNFITWFIQQFMNIGQTMIGKLDLITIAPNITLLDFTITIAIIGAFLSIIITTPTLNVVKRTGRNKREEKKEK